MDTVSRNVSDVDNITGWRHRKAGLEGCGSREGDGIRVCAAKVIIYADAVDAATVTTGDEDVFAVGGPCKADGLCASEGDALAQGPTHWLDQVELMNAGPAADHCQGFAIRREGGSLQHVRKQNRCPCWFDFPSSDDARCAIRQLTD